MRLRVYGRITPSNGIFNVEFRVYDSGGHGNVVSATAGGSVHGLVKQCATYTEATLFRAAVLLETAAGEKSEFASVGAYGEGQVPDFWERAHGGSDDDCDDCDEEDYEE